jgi:hypothetical protein
MLERNTVRSENRCALIKGIGRKTHSSIKKTVVNETELNNYTLYRYCILAAVLQLNTVKQQHTSTATLKLTTKSTYRSLSAQRLSERTIP